MFEQTIAGKQIHFFTSLHVLKLITKIKMLKDKTVALATKMNEKLHLMIDGQASDDVMKRISDLLLKLLRKT